MNVAKGVYTTKVGFRAIVSRLKTRCLEWMWVGAVEDPHTGILMITAWHANGESRISPDLNLVSRVSE